VENLDYNENYKKDYLNLDNMIRKLVMYIDYAVKYKEETD